jgi:hypothetical protein
MVCEQENRYRLTVGGHAHPITLAATIADEFRDPMALGGS